MIKGAGSKVVRVADAEEKLDRLGEELGNAKVTGKDGAECVDVEAFVKTVRQANDPALEKGVAAIRSSFVREEERSTERRRDGVTSFESVWSRSVPTSLSPTEAKSVFAAIVDAKRLVRQHLGADGELSPAELASAKNLRTKGLSGRLAAGVIEGLGEPAKK